MRDEHVVSIDAQRCVRCGLCVADCPSGALRTGENGVETRREGCIGCGHCVAICPQDAVAMTGFEDAPEPIAGDAPVEPDALLAQMKARRSIRRYAARDIAPETIERIIEAGRYTPTGSNTQAVSYVVLREERDACERIAVGILRRLKKVADVFFGAFRDMQIDDQFLFKGAPVVIVIKAASTVDGALAASSMELMARSLGLGALYSGFFTQIAGMSRRLKRMLGVSSREKIITTLVLGYPAVTYRRTAPKERPSVRYL